MWSIFLTLGSVAGFIIGFLILGLIVGLIVGYLVIVKRSIKLPLPESIINPNYRSA